MKPNTLFFTHARLRVSLPISKMQEKTKAKKTRGFLDLPGEIKNRIYQYYFQDTYRCELVGEGCDFNPTAVKLLSYPRLHQPHLGVQLDKAKAGGPVAIRFPRLRRPHRAPSTGSRINRGWLNPHGALILVCKQIHVETLALLYCQITFVFEAPRRIANFLHRLPKQNHDNVTKLHLYYSTYGSPDSAGDVIWQDKHIKSWSRACKAIATSLSCLRELEIDIWINDYAPKFNLRQKWLKPLLHFRRLTCDYSHGGLPGESTDQKLHTLEKVSVRVRTRLFTHDFDMNAPLCKACKHLHKLYGLGISRAILGAKEEEAMAKFNTAWGKKYKIWQHHLGFARTGW
jgi:hypothetical protein